MLLVAIFRIAMNIYFDSLKSRQKFLAFSDLADSVGRMAHSGFLSDEDRKVLTALARDVSMANS